MTDDERDKMRDATSEACDAFMRKIGEKYPWLHPDFDPESPVWRERRRRAWNAQRRQPYLY